MNWRVLLQFIFPLGQCEKKMKSTARYVFHATYWVFVHGFTISTSRHKQLKLIQSRSRWVRECNCTIFSSAGSFLDRFPWMRLPWECRDQSQETNCRLCVNGPELPFLHKRKGILKIDQYVKMPWHRLSSSAPVQRNYALLKNGQIRKRFYAFRISKLSFSFVKPI